MKKRRPQLAADVREELEAHLAFCAAELVARGMSPEQAEREARACLGDATQVTRDVLEVHDRWEGAMRRREYLRDFLHDVKLAGRQLLRRKLFAAVAIGVIALGIGAASAVFAVVDAALLRPLPFDDGDRLVAVYDQQGAERGLPSSFPEFRDWERGAEFADGMAAVYTAGVRIKNADGATWDRVPVTRLAGDPARTFGIRPLLGRWFSADELRQGARVALLAEEAWRTRFGAAGDVVGRTIDLGADPYTIIGVLPASAQLVRGYGDETALWLPAAETPETADRGLHMLNVFARLRPGVSVPQAQAATEVLAKRLQAAAVTDHGITIRPARDALVGDTRPLLYVLTGAALFVLLIVCANLASLFLSKFLLRGREFAVRVALGAGRRRLLRLVLTESVIVALLGGAGGLLLSLFMLNVTRAAARQAGALAPTSTVDLRVIGFAFALALVVGGLSGLWTAMRATRVDPAAALKDTDPHATGGRGAVWRRKLLVGVQLAVGVVLFSGTGMLVHSLLRMLGEDPGFQPHGALVFRMLLAGPRFDDDAASRAFMAELDRRVAALPGVTAAGVASELPLELSDINGDLRIEGRPTPPGARWEVKKRVIGPGYFASLRIPLRAGRAFTAADRGDTPGVVIIDETLRRTYFPDEDPVGKRLHFDWGPDDPQGEEVVGVVGDVRHNGLDQPVHQGMVYRPFTQFPRRYVQYVVRTSGSPRALEPLLRREAAALDGTVAVYDVRTVDHIFAASTAARRTLIWLLAGFAAIALLLAAMGVYGVISLVVTQKTREIGLRMAIGAQRRDILKLVLGEAASMMGAGLVVGLAAALLCARALAGMLYGVSTADPASLIAAAVLLVGVGLLATWLPARRAARLDPMIAMRTE